MLLTTAALIMSVFLICTSEVPAGFGEQVAAVEWPLLFITNPCGA